MEKLKQDLNNLILELNSLCEIIINADKIVSALEDTNNKDVYNANLKQLLILFDEYRRLTDLTKEKLKEYNLERKKNNLPEEVHYRKLLNELNSIPTQLE